MVDQLPPAATVLAKIHSHPTTAQRLQVLGPSTGDVVNFMQTASFGGNRLEKSYVVESALTKNGLRPVLLQLEFKPAFWLVGDVAALARAVRQGEVDMNDYVQLRYVALPGQAESTRIPVNVAGRVPPTESGMPHTLLRPENIIGANADTSYPLLFPQHQPALAP
jgi:hypothetical protein